MGGEELKLVQDTFASNWIAPLGPQVDAFEREFSARVGHEHAAALSSGTAALHLAMRWLNLHPSDEVICSSLTFSASVNPVLYERATPVFVDCDERSWNMDPTLLAEAVADGIKRGKKPKAVILVHLYGQCADIDPIAAICAEHDIPLIEDAAEALGAVYYGTKAKPETVPLLAAANPVSVPAVAGQRNLKPESFGNSSSLLHRLPEGHPSQSASGHSNAMPSPPPGSVRSQASGLSDDLPVSGLKSQVSASRPGVAPGTVGLCGVHSFNGNKIITTSGGGMLTSSDPKLIEKARFWATQARDPAPHYEHSEVGFNYRMSNVLAAIGRGQLRVLDQRVEARRRNCAFYQAAFKDLPGVTFMPEAEFGRCTRWLTCLTVDPKLAGTDREKIRLALGEQNIEARPVWKPMHLQPIFKGCRCYGGDVSVRLFEQGLCLPSGSNLTTADLERVVDAFRQVFHR